LLSPSKGAERLRKLLAGFDHTLDGEWLQQTNRFVAFDLPDCTLDYDGRREALAKVLGAAPAYDVALLSHETRLLGVRLIGSFTAGHFPQVYAGLKGLAEGVVLKRRRSMYAKQGQANKENRDWIKRRFAWD
jgi:hypothetical protein